MFMTLTTFFITGIIFFILQFFINGVWIYYIPCALIGLTIWLKSIQPVWSADRLLTVFAKPTLAQLVLTYG